MTVGLSLLAGAAAARAQDAIEPAEAIRVVELVSRTTGRLERDVASPAWPSEILRVQVELAAVGFDPRVRTGALDRSTRRSLRRFQIARGLRICGCLTYETIVALAIHPVVVIAYAQGIDHRPVLILGMSKRHRKGVAVGHRPLSVRKRPHPLKPRSSVGVRTQSTTRPPQPGARIQRGGTGLR